MSTYASKTTVSADKTRSEIERTLKRYGADEFAFASSSARAMVAFRAENRNVRFVLQLPERASREFTHTPTTGVRRTAESAEREYDQEIRQRWRALALLVKAKLEAVESGIVTFEEEFLAHILLPGGQTVHENISPAIESAYQSGQVRSLLQITS